MKSPNVKSKYRIVQLPMDDPRRTDSRTTIGEHVLIAERALGKRLPKGAQVHHFNEDRSDNRPQNLVICEGRTYHALLHTRARILRAGGDPDIHVWCGGGCRTFRLPEDMQPSGQSCKECSRSRARTPQCRAAARRHTPKVLIPDLVGNKFWGRGVVAAEDEDVAVGYAEFALALSPSERRFLDDWQLTDLVSDDFSELQQTMLWYRKLAQRQYVASGAAWFMSESCCLVPRCGAQGRSRGVCATHYQIALRLVRAGRTTWASLEARHKVLPPQTTHNDMSHADTPPWLVDSSAASSESTPASRESVS